MKMATRDVRASRARPQAEAGGQQVQKIVAAIIGLGIGHVVLYLCLTADARAALRGLSTEWTPAQLEASQAPGPMPVPGTSSYSEWLHAYEGHHAAKEHALQSRHEGLMRYGMLFSFLIAAGILGSAVLRYRRGQRRAVRSPARARAPMQARAPARVPSGRRHPVPARAAVPARTAVAARAGVPARAAPVLPHAVRPGYRRSA
jgi:hypothetical protein